VAGLLQQIAARKPDLAHAIAEVVGQVQAIAQVYGLQVGTEPLLRLENVVKAITTSVQRLFAHPINLRLEGPHASDWLLPEAESIPIALCLNELLTNAHKHGQHELPISCTLHSNDQGVHIRITNAGNLPTGFSFDHVPGGVSGLGLVRALAPRRSSTITLKQQDGHVVTELQLRPPGIRLMTPPPVLAEPTVQQYALWPQ
jgi:two-component sensor histidine kinase